MKPDYPKLLKKWYPYKQQTKCLALARYRYKRYQHNSTLGLKIIEKKVMKRYGGKCVVIWEVDYRRF